MMQQSNTVTLSEDLLKQIDQLLDKTFSRSEFVENILRRYLLIRQTNNPQKSGDLDIINKNAEYLNQEAEDVLDYQIEL